MRQTLALAAALCGPILLAGSTGASPAVHAGGEQPGAPLPFFRHSPLDGGPEGFSGLPGLRSGAPLPEPAPPGDDKPSAGAPAPRAPTRAEALDRLMGRLAGARDADEARGIAALVERLWMASGSDTADLLMSRAVTAMGEKRQDVASALLDKLIEIRPGWAEAWNKRATLRFLEGDDTGSMEDISHVLALEPRHFGALSGMGIILSRHGEDAAALRALRRALAVYPGDVDVRRAIEKLAPTVEGLDL